MILNTDYELFIMSPIDFSKITLSLIGYIGINDQCKPSAKSGLLYTWEAAFAPCPEG